MATEVFGFLAVAAMVIMHALEQRSYVFLRQISQVHHPAVMIPKAETTIVRVEAAVGWTSACSLGRVAMYQSAARLITAVVVAATGIYAGYRLVLYADRDDAPGGMVIGTALLFGSLVLGIWIARRRTHKPSSNRS